MGTKTKNAKRSHYGAIQSSVGHLTPSKRVPVQEEIYRIKVDLFPSKVADRS